MTPPPTPRLAFPLLTGIAACALLLVACATPNASSNLLSESGLTPSYTVASNDGFGLETEPDASLAEHAKLPPPSTTTLLAPKTPSEPHRLLVQPTPNHTTRITLTPLTLGEALVFSTHTTPHALNIPGALFEFTTPEDAHIDLSSLAHYSTLLALESLTLSPSGDVVAEHHELLQLAPVKATTSVSPTDETLVIVVTDRFNNAPLQGAEVELIDAESRRLERGTTNRNGRLGSTAPTAAAPTLFGPTLFLTIRNGQSVALIAVD